MTRQELIREIEEIKRLLVEEYIEGITDYAREHAYIDLDDAIEMLTEN